MQCNNLVEGEQCTRQASYNSNFCTVCDNLYFKVMRKNSVLSKHKYASKSDLAFTPHSDKLTKAEKIFINGLGNKPKPVIKIKEKPIMTTEPRKITEPSLLTISEVANMLRVSQLTLKRWGKLGKLPCIRINSRGDRRYLRSEINKLLGDNV